MKIFTLALQHLLAMYAGAVIVPLIIGGALGLSGEQLTYLVAADIFMCGAATLLQVLKNKFMGIGLPIVLGCTFTAVAPIIAIGKEYGIGAVYGSILAAGLFMILIAGFFGKLVRFFPPVVTGSVVTIIGLTLIPAAMNNMAGGEGSESFGSAGNLSLSFGVLLFIVLLFKFSKGFIQSIAILAGLAAGTAAASFAGMVNFQAVADASWINFPHPFYFGTPVFKAAPILTMILVALVSMVESTGVYMALSNLTGRKISEEDLKKGYRAEGTAYLLGGMFNALPYTAYSQNVGLVQLSGIKKPLVISVMGIMLIVLGLVPKIAAFATIIPSPVIGGAMVAMFGMVIAYGIKMLSTADLRNQENLFVIACSIGIGLGVTAVPEMFSQLPGSLKILAGNGIVAGSLTAIALNILFSLKSRKTEAGVQERQAYKQATS